MFIKYTNVVGLQWGDEGKGRIVDFLAKNNDIIARYNGGNNAGHTVKVEDKEFKFHLLPSGSLYRKQLYIGPGTIINPHVLIKEIQTLEKYGVEFLDRLVVSHKAHLIMPYHILLDECREKQFNFGTTKQGIGPAYADKYARFGIQMRDLFDEVELKKKIEKALFEKNPIFKLHGLEELQVEPILKSTLELKEVLADYIMDINERFYTRYKDKSVNILLEGAQGLMLDIDSDEYPYVTSTHVNPKFHYMGLLDNNKQVDAISYNNIGVMKAYSTKVGSGNFVCEMDENTAFLVRELGKEYGTTTGRPRRCGWLDLVQLKKVLNENEINTLHLTKLDVLSGLKEIKVVLDYDGDKKPIYKTFPGWNKVIGDIRKYEDLPLEARNYVEFIESILDDKFKLISVGPERNQLIERNI